MQRDPGRAFSLHLTYAKKEKDDLMEQITQKKAFMEELLGVTLTKVSNVTFFTTADYGAGSSCGSTTSGYDPETNTLPAVTTLSITFDIGTGKPAVK